MNDGRDELRVHVRWMIRCDHPEVLAIERAGFASAWREEDLLHALRQRNCIGMVAEAGERVVGFMVYELHRDRLRVLRLAVHPEYRRRGVGRQMAAKLAGKLSSHRRTRLVVEVRESALPAQLFLRAQGFRATKVLRGHYADTGEDAYAMAYDLEQPAGVGASHE